jgi:23S rRNA (cytidine1920-2'-O)/16S rRNA (cytidine1409-2'-O)-methyltransferase
MKLDGALSAFHIDVTGMICADIGASTGGFTDCLLKRGASHVYAVDSGAGQLDPTLCADSRVTNIEHFNARNLTLDTFGRLCDIAVADLSFISQTYILQNVRDILRPGGMYVGLIKPQFECGRSALDRHGIVKSRTHHKAAITRVLDCAVLCGLVPRAVIPSPITGGDGNREFLICFTHRKTDERRVTEELLARVTAARTSL